MTAFRFRWRPLAAVVLAVIWIVGVVRYVSRDAKVPAPLTTYVPAAPAPVPQVPEARQAELAATTVPAAAPAAPAVAPAAPAAPAVAPAAPAAPAALAAPAASVAPAAPAAPGTASGAPAAVAPTAPVAAPTAPAAAANATAAPSLHDRLWSAVTSVTLDGSRILVAVSGRSFFARVDPDLHLTVWDRHGKVVQEQVVQDMELVEQNLGEGNPSEVRAKAKAQELAAGKLLDALERKGLSSKELLPAVIVEPDSSSYPHRAAYTQEGETAPSVTFDLSPTGTLTIKPRGHAAITRHNAAWRSVPTPAQEHRIQESLNKGENGCYNPALLRGALVDLGRRVAIVTIGYHGNDTCWEGPDEETVVAW